jgi:hypothetical protein
MKIYLKFSVKLAKMMYNVSQWESSSIPKFSTMQMRERANPYIGLSSTPLTIKNNYFPLVLQGIE